MLRRNLFLHTLLQIGRRVGHLVDLVRHRNCFKEIILSRTHDIRHFARQKTFAVQPAGKIFRLHNNRHPFMDRPQQAVGTRRQYASGIDLRSVRTAPCLDQAAKSDNSALSRAHPVGLSLVLPLTAPFIETRCRDQGSPMVQRRTERILLCSRLGADVEHERPVVRVFDP